MDELLFAFCGDDFICKDIKIIDFDLSTFSITVSCKGETFDLAKHPQVQSHVRLIWLPPTHVVTNELFVLQGTEVKAMTYSEMQIHDKSKSADGKYHVYVIVDI